MMYSNTKGPAYDGPNAANGNNNAGQEDFLQQLNAMPQRGGQKAGQGDPQGAPLGGGQGPQTQTLPVRFDRGRRNPNSGY